MQLSLIWILAALFAAGSLFGYCFEAVCFDKLDGDANLNALLPCRVPLLMIYGAALVLLYGVGRAMPASAGLLSKSAVAALLITALEYACGQASLALHGEHTWSYADWPLPFGNDYCCVPASLGWFALAAAFFAIVG